MTELMKDILQQPEALSGSMARICGPGKSALEKAAQIVNEAEHLYITGMGSSWHAGMSVLSFFHSKGRAADLVEASEFDYSTQIAKDSAVIVLSRSGKSIEIVRLLSQARRAGARVIAITNTPESPLAQTAEITLNVQAPFDHFVSVTMYSALALAGGLLACTALGTWEDALIRLLDESLMASRPALDRWIQQIRLSSWFKREAPAYFLARGGSLASCHEARLLWEEAAKAPATAMTTGGFRHGPQEIIVDGLCFGLWIDSDRKRDQDLAVAADIRKLGGKVLLIGQDLTEDASDLVFRLPKIPSPWQFLIDIFPIQLAAEHLSHIRGVDCDSFRICSYIVEDEHGLIREPMRNS
jgi:glucosamine--fructose-6-phosphate aminotransferase (isomerizing)